MFSTEQCENKARTEEPTTERRVKRKGKASGSKSVCGTYAEFITDLKVKVNSLNSKKTWTPGCLTKNFHYIFYLQEDKVESREKGERTKIIGRK